MSVVGRFVKHRGLFLGDAFVWLLLLGLNLRSVMTNGGLFSIALSIGAVVFAIGSIRLSAFFGPPKAEP